VTGVEVVARAKINLYLAVGQRRDDGYHELSSVMQSVDLSDTLVVRHASTAADPIPVAFAAGPGFVGDLPVPPDLVEQALAMYAAEVEGAGPFAAEVTKSIPLAAGLAGGSADAAAALLGADAAGGGQLTRDRLEAMGRRLGSDVTFCLRGGTALVQGTGNLVTPMACPHRLWWVLGISDFPLRAAEVYQRFDEMSPAPPGRPERPIHLAKALVGGHPKVIAKALRNDLEAAAFDLAPGLSGRKHAMRAVGAVGAVLSGSGPTIAGLCRNEAHAEEVARRAEEAFARVEVVASAEAGAEVLAVQR
jgi:4-diphosphocytidyl-2-C-methyl-D-erythritol kinase